MIGANLLVLLSLAIPLPRTLGWMRYAVLIAPLIAVRQVVGEGPRWQMIPAYLLTVAFFLVWWAGLAMPGGPGDNPRIDGLGVGLAVLALSVSAALPVVLPVFHFREPTGPYAVGTVTYHWVAPSRPEFFTTDPTDHRELIAAGRNQCV